MEGRSKLWPIAATLIAAGAALEAAAVWLYWLPCAGSMLNGSSLRGYRYESEFTAGCMVAMDEASMFVLPQPGAGWTLVGSLGAAAAILLAAAWLVLLPALRVSRMAKLIAALPGILGIALVIDAVVLSFGTAAVDDWIGRALVVLIELSVLLALVALGSTGVEGLLLARYAIVAFGGVRSSV